MYPILAIIGVLAIILVYYYNKLVRLGFLLKEGWSGIDVQLKRRHDLIPNLVEMVKGYSQHERQTLEEVTRLRDVSRATENIQEKSGLENNISTDLKKLFALVESYPDLKADQNFRKLQDSLSEVEDNLQYARRYYNGTVRDYNILVQSLPSNLVAKMFHFEAGKFFEIEYATERQSPDVKF